MSLVSGIGGSGRKARRNAEQDDPEVVLGEDWVAPDAAVRGDLAERRDRRGLISINRSPLARKIISFNMVAIVVLVAGILYLKPFREGVVYQRDIGLVVEAELLSDVIAAHLAGAEGDASAGLATVFESFVPPSTNRVHLFDADGALVATVGDHADPDAVQNMFPQPDVGSTLITDFLRLSWDTLRQLVGSEAGGPGGEGVGPSVPELKPLVEMVLKSANGAYSDGNRPNPIEFAVAAPIMQGNQVVGAVAVVSAAAQIDRLVRAEREQVLQMFVIAALVSIGLSLVLASTIANPLCDLAAAAEVGQERNSNKLRQTRIRIPDLSARPDEIGRLSRALRGMVSALYDRIDANEQFAADVAHEIKNPLASLRSAVGTLRVAKKPEHQVRLMDVIDHDVKRLDRLVSDISNASRLDSELVREDEETFDLLNMISTLVEHLAFEAKEKGVDFISDLPPEPIQIHGLEARLAQVFVNLVSNATSFCEEGDAIRIWARRRENRVLIVVEDTGPGIPEEALGKIFNRFYSERPVSQFGNNSGLGLAISKQIVEAHGGVIWAENIRAADADAFADPLGARFVVGLPL
ncbi:MAG: HAMP domain-containing protein [Rhodobacteraceae bacterium]|nr:HAMP domain-containing protein [Paracoccaceae bacterium]